MLCLCACGVCGLKVSKEENKFIHGHNKPWLGKKMGLHTKEWNENIRKSMIGKKLGPRSDESIRSTAEKLTGRTKENNEGRRIQAEKMTGRTKETHEGVRRGAEKRSGRTKETYEYLRKLSEKMKNGGAIHANSFNKNDSKPENELFILTCRLLPRPIHKFPIYRGKGKRNYTVDIGDSSVGIILEYDGWYHFYEEDRKEYDKKRQKEIEEDGWKFLRYNIFQKVPTLEQVKEDIQKVLNGVN